MVEAARANWRMLWAKRWAMSGGMSRKPKVTNGPTLSTAIEMVRPMRRNKRQSQRSTFFLRVTAMSRSKETRRNSFLKRNRARATTTKVASVSQRSKSETVMISPRSSSSKPRSPMAFQYGEEENGGEGEAEAAHKGEEAFVTLEMAEVHVAR